MGMSKTTAFAVLAFALWLYRMGSNFYRIMNPMHGVKALPGEPVVANLWRQDIQVIEA